MAYTPVLLNFLNTQATLYLQLNYINQYGQKTLFMWSFYWLKKSL